MLLLLLFFVATPSLALTEDPLVDQPCPTTLSGITVTGELDGNQTDTDRSDQDTNRLIVQCTTCSIGY